MLRFVPCAPINYQGAHVKYPQQNKNHNYKLTNSSKGKTECYHFNKILLLCLQISRISMKLVYNRPGIDSGASFPVASITSLKLRAAQATVHSLLSASTDLQYFIEDSIQLRLDRPDPPDRMFTFEHLDFNLPTNSTTELLTLYA